MPETLRRAKQICLLSFPGLPLKCSSLLAAKPNSMILSLLFLIPPPPFPCLPLLPSPTLLPSEACRKSRASPTRLLSVYAASKTSARVLMHRRRAFGTADIKDARGLFGGKARAVRRRSGMRRAEREWRGERGGGRAQDVTNICSSVMQPHLRSST